MGFLKKFLYNHIVEPNENVYTHTHKRGGGKNYLYYRENVSWNFDIPTRVLVLIQTLEEKLK